MSYIKFIYLATCLTINLAIADEVTQTTTCPPPNQLVKQNNIWVTTTNWRSYNPSFIEEINVFIKAQWQGELIGKLICVYGDNNSTTSFPVLMQAPFLSVLPENSNWIQSKSNKKVFSCQGPKIEDCPILPKNIKEKPLESTEDVLDFLRSIK